MDSQSQITSEKTRLTESLVILIAVVRNKTSDADGEAGAERRCQSANEPQITSKSSTTNFSTWEGKSEVLRFIRDVSTYLVWIGMEERRGRRQNGRRIARARGRLMMVTVLNTIDGLAFRICVRVRGCSFDIRMTTILIIQSDAAN